MDNSFGQLKILLVDDNAHMHAIMATVLKSLGVHDIVSARDGGEGIERLRSWPADIAFVDFKMSPIDGVDFTRLVRQSPSSPCPFLPIVMTTGHANRSRVAEARDAGVTEFIVKPITAKAVADRLNAVIFNPRPFVKTGDYVGPSRRRVSSGGAPNMPQRRATDRKITEI
jgi:CheY-like chemotaxis protein